jgi:NAD(P)-dependent dehydrogenase (short-subunit alcohol dehydrogenase family)
VLSGVRLARLYLPAMRRRDWGRIIFIASESAVRIPSEMIHYGVSKIAQIGVARGLAEAVAGTGITVNLYPEGGSGALGSGGNAKPSEGVMRTTPAATEDAVEDQERKR